MLAELAEAEFRLWGISRVKSVRGGWGQLPRIPTISSYTMLLVATIYRSLATPICKSNERGIISGRSDWSELQEAEEIAKPLRPVLGDAYVL